MRLDWLFPAFTDPAYRYSSDRTATFLPTSSVASSAPIAYSDLTGLSVPRVAPTDLAATLIASDSGLPLHSLANLVNAPTAGFVAAGAASSPGTIPPAFAAGKLAGVESPVGIRADTAASDAGSYEASGVTYLERWWDGTTYPVPTVTGVDTFAFTGTATATNGGLVSIYHSWIPDGSITTSAFPTAIIADGVSNTEWPYQYASRVEITNFAVVSAGRVTARNGGQVLFQDVANTSVNPFTIHTDGNNLAGSKIDIIQLTAGGSGSPAPMDRGLSITDSVFGHDPGVAGPDTNFSGFTNYTFTNSVVDGGALNILGASGGYFDPGTWNWVTVSSVVSGTVPLINGARGTWQNLVIGQHLDGVTPNPLPVTTISIDATSTLNLQDVDLYNVQWWGLNGTLNIVTGSTVRDGGYLSGLDPSGTGGTINVQLGATLTTVNMDNANSWGNHGHPGITLTGAGTISQMYPVNHGTILSSPNAGEVLTIYALGAGQTWIAQSTDPTVSDLPTQPGGSQTFYNFSDGVVHFQQGGGLYFVGFSGGFDNEGLILYTSTIDWVTSGDALNDANHIFSLNGYGTMRADGAGVVWGGNPVLDYNALIEQQHMEAINGAKIEVDGYRWNHDTLYVGAKDAYGVGSKINLTHAGNSTIDRFNPATMGDPSGSITLVGRGSATATASLTLPDANLTASALGPAIAVSGFTTYNLAGTNGAVVSGGTMLDLGMVTGPVYDLEGGTSTNYTTLYGKLTLSNHSTGTLHDVLIGNYIPGYSLAEQPAATVISIDASSSLTVRNATTMNTVWVDNNILYIDGTVNDGGYGSTLMGHGIFFINAGATMTTQGTALGDHWNVFGMQGMTLTGQGTADRMYPVNHGTILSPTSGALTIKALASGSWENDPTYPLAGSSQTFYNYADGVVRFAGGGGIDFKGFTDGFNNQGLIEVTSTAAWDASPSGLNGHVFSTLSDGTHPLGTMQANGAGVVWQGIPGVDDNATIDYQNIRAINGATINFNGFDVHHSVLSTDASSHFGVGVGVDKASGADTGTPNLNALTTFSSSTLTGGSTVLKLSGNDAIGLDSGSSTATPALTVSDGATLQLYGDSTSRLLSTGGTGAVATLAVGSGAVIAGAGNTSSHQVRLILGDGGTLTVFNPGLAHTAGIINLADAPVLPASPFRFSAARAPGTTTGGAVSAASLPGATASQTLTLLGDLQMAAAATLNVTIFGDSTNANSLLMVGSAGTSASTLNGTLSVTAWSFVLSPFVSG